MQPLTLEFINQSHSILLNGLRYCPSHLNYLLGQLNRLECVKMSLTQVKIYCPLFLASFRYPDPNLLFF